jgi:hypothetical protein
MKSHGTGNSNPSPMADDFIPPQPVEGSRSPSTQNPIHPNNHQRARAHVAAEANRDAGASSEAKPTAAISSSSCCCRLTKLERKKKRRVGSRSFHSPRWRRTSLRCSARAPPRPVALKMGGGRRI